MKPQTYSSKTLPLSIMTTGLIVITMLLAMRVSNAQATTTPPIIRSGTLSTDETWSGEILITGDVVVPTENTLTILPGTTVLFAANSDDQAGGHYPDKTELLVFGKLSAVGALA